LENRFSKKYIALLAVPLAMASIGVTLASNNSLGNTEVEFGRGQYQISACQSWININLDNAYFNNVPTPPTPDFYLNKITIANLNTNACKSTKFKLKFLSASQGSSISSTDTKTLGPYGGDSGGILNTSNCDAQNGTQVVVGARVYQFTSDGYVAGIRALCENLNLDGNRFLSTSVIGTSTTLFQDISCPTGNVGRGLNVRSGSILDAFGMVCGPADGNSTSLIQNTGGGGAGGPDLCGENYILNSLQGFNYLWYGSPTVTKLSGICGYKQIYSLLPVYTYTSPVSEVVVGINSAGTVYLEDTNTSAISLEYVSDSGNYVIHLDQPLAIMSNVDKLTVESSSI